MEAIEIPQDIGRNDPCPCGSGKKYKKCHMRIHQAQREAAKKTRTIEKLIGPDTIPFKAYVTLAQINANNLLALAYDSTHELGPWRAQFENKDAFLLAATEERTTIPAHADYEFLRYRVDSPDVHILLAKGATDPRQTKIAYQVITLRRNEADAEGNARAVQNAGWRVWDIKEATVDKSEVEAEDGDRHLSEFGIAWHPRDVRDYPTHVRTEEAPSSEEE